MAASEDPFVGSNFTLEIDKAPVASFTECSGIKVEVEAIESIENDLKGVQVIRKIPGRYKPQPITLKRPMDSSMQMFEWFQKSLAKSNEAGKRDQFGSARGTMSLVIHDTAGNEKARYNLKEAWISAHDAGALKASDNAVMTETITIQLEGLHRVK
jgi:phage tail-like protein